jgi:hypothetical protein
MKFREDYKIIFPMNPDIVVIPECENINKIDLGSFSKKVTDSYWIGDNESKGLGIFTFNGFKIELYENYNDKYKYILPLIISRENETYNLIGCWTKKVSGGLEYIEQLQHSLDDYNSFLDDKNVIICGDLNSNQYWVNMGGDDLNHQDVVDKLSKKGIHSSYHHFFNEEQGKETTPTFYHYHKEDKPFHIDYCFLSNSLIDRLKKVEIGKYDDWMNYSDHVPLIIDLTT